MIVGEKRRVTSQITAHFLSADFVLFPVRLFGFAAKRSATLMARLGNLPKHHY
jgi:hypothetical protein